MSTFTLLLLSTIFMITYYSSMVECRTCVCAEFLETACNEHPNCEWNDAVPSSEQRQGHAGVCRSEKFMRCHRDPACTVAGQDPRLRSTAPPAVKPEDYVPPGDDQTNDQTPSEDDDQDWPWDCDSTPPQVIYAEYTINVAAIELAANNINQQIMGKTNIDQVEMVKNSEPATSLYHNFGSLQVIAGVSFVVILIPSLIYYKCKGHGLKNNKFLGSDYSTFSV